METADCIYPALVPEVVAEFDECDFGIFEYKNYQELKDEPAYQHFLDTLGESGFPKGESLVAFKERCRKAFAEKIGECMEADRVAFVVHGGTIMSVLDAYSSPHRDYYDWQVGNGAHGKFWDRGCYECNSNGKRLYWKE